MGNIEQKTQWKVKEMAGNIIPAIATSNAIIAGLIVIQAVKVLRQRVQDCRDVSLRKQATSFKLIIPNMPDERRHDCVVCMEKPTVTLRCNTNKMLLGHFGEKVCQTALSMLEPDCEFGADVILSSEEGDTTDAMLAKSLADFGVAHGAELVAEDFQQDFRVTIHVEHVEQLEKEYSEQGFQLVGSDEAKATAAAETVSKDKTESRKRPIEDANDAIDSPAKKLKKIEIDDDNDLIMI